MPRCNQCEKKGFFLSLDERGLCGECSPLVAMDIQQRVRIMDDSKRLASEGKTFTTRFSRFQLLIEQLEHLLEYEKRNISTLTPSPSKLLDDLRGYEHKIISEETAKVSEKAKKQAQVAINTTAKFNLLAKASLKVQEIYSAAEQKKGEQQAVNELQELMHRVKLDGYLESAEKARFKGNIKKAIDQYKEALFYAMSIDLPDNQTKIYVDDVRKNISELEGE